MFVDATWADCLDTRRSTTGFVGMLNGGPVCWKCQKQPIVAQSSCEAEFIAACKGANEISFIRDLLGEWGLRQGTTRMYEDNTAAKQLIALAPLPWPTSYKSYRVNLEILVYAGH